MNFMLSDFLDHLDAFHSKTKIMYVVAKDMYWLSKKYVVTFENP